MAKKKRKFFSLFVFPGLIGILLFVLLPFGDVVKRSFTTAVTGQWNGLKNYETIFHNQAFMLAVNNTLKFTIICIPLLVFTGFSIALLLNGLKSKKWMKSIFLFPLAMPTATIVLVWKMVFYRQGFLNLFLSGLGEMTGLWGEIHKDYLGSNAAFWVLIGSYIWKNTEKCSKGCGASILRQADGFASIRSRRRRLRCTSESSPNGTANNWRRR